MNKIKAKTIESAGNERREVKRPRGRPRKSAIAEREEMVEIKAPIPAAKSDIPKGLVEYKNVAQTGEEMILEIFGEEAEINVVKVKPGDTIFLNEKDIRRHTNDKRFLEGRIVPVDSEEELKATIDIGDIISDERLKYFVVNTKDTEVLKEKLENIKNINTMTRLLREVKKEEHGKTYAFVAIIEEKLNEMVKFKEQEEYGLTAEKEEE